VALLSRTKSDLKLQMRRRRLLRVQSRHSSEANFGCHQFVIHLCRMDDDAVADFKILERTDRFLAAVAMYVSKAEGLSLALKPRRMAVHPRATAPTNPIAITRNTARFRIALLLHPRRGPPAQSVIFRCPACEALCLQMTAFSVVVTGCRLWAKDGMHASSATAIRTRSKGRVCMIQKFLSSKLFS